MKTHFIYLSFSTLLYSSLGLCSDIDIDEENLQAALQLSLRNSDHEFAANLSSQINFDETSLTEQQKDEHLLLEEYYAFQNLPPRNNAPSNKLKEQAPAEEEEIKENYILIFGEIFQTLGQEYNDALKNSELLHFPNNPLLYHLDNLFVYDESDEELAERVQLTVEDLKKLKKSTIDRLKEVKRLVAVSGILEPKDQKEKMIEKFINKIECTREFAEKVYKKFINED